MIWTARPDVVSWTEIGKTGESDYEIWKIHLTFCWKCLFYDLEVAMRKAVVGGSHEGGDACVRG